MLLSPHPWKAASLAGVFLAFSASSLPLGAQESYIGVVAGRTATRLQEDPGHHGAMAGGFFQMEFYNHLGLRSEVVWARTGAREYSMDSTLPPGDAVVLRNLDYLDANVVGRITWKTGALPPLGSRVGLTAFGGGWVGAHIRGDIGGYEPRGHDFGHLAGVGFFWAYDPILLQADARSIHGEARYWDQGPRRRGSQLVLSLGYRVR